jgi:hypothetical protein
MSIELTAMLPELEQAQVDISVRVSATLNITPFVARQKVNRLVATTVGTGLGGGKPALVAEDGRLRWRVPVYLALPGKGRLGQVGQIDVDAQTGETLADDELLDAIGDHAERLAAGSAL